MTSRTSKDYFGTLAFLTVFLVIASVVLGFQSAIAIPVAGLWALASVGAGGVVGFLFGVPRALEQPEAPATERSTNGGDERGAADSKSRRVQRFGVNTNLEQISDWLTKILVGVGLIELRKLPEVLGSSATFVAGASNSPAAAPVAVAIMLTFSVIGFLTGYLMTRLYLTGAFERAVDDMLTVGGQELPIEKLSEQVRFSIADIQDQLVALRAAPRGSLVPLEPLSERLKERQAAGPRSILWVDDHPENNSLLIERLVMLGVTVVTAKSTAEGVQRFKSGRYDRIISDMGRREGLRNNPRAGIDLVRHVRAQDPSIPVIIYCSAEAAAQLRQEAIEAGATAVTSSPTVLLQALDLDASASRPIPPLGALDPRPRVPIA